MPRRHRASPSVALDKNMYVESVGVEMFDNKYQLHGKIVNKYFYAFQSSESVDVGQPVFDSFERDSLDI